MLSNALYEFESVRDAQAYRTLGMVLYSDSKNWLQSSRVFFSIHAWFLFLSREKTQIEAIRLFRVYTSLKITGDRREVSEFEEFLWSNFFSGELPTSVDLPTDDWRGTAPRVTDWLSKVMGCHQQSGDTTPLRV